MFKQDRMWHGVVAGLVMPLVTMYVFYLTNYGRFEFVRFIQIVMMQQSFSALLSISVVGNVAAFFFFMWKDRLRASRGVIFSMFIYAIPIIYFKYLA